jgi:malonate transporter and related proteins
MLAALTAILPIFALILVGYVCRKSGALGANATSELNRFVVYLALPALLFDVAAHTTWTAFYQPGFIATFGLSSGAIFALTVAFGLRRRRTLASASIDGLNASYANTGFIGFPLCLLVFGNDSLAPTATATVLTACLLFAVAIVLIEADMHSEAGPARLALNVGRSLVSNPLLVAPALGVAIAATGVGLPVGVETFVKLLGAAASPCALVALGLFLARDRGSDTGEPRAAWLFVLLKLIVQPAIAWALAAPVFALPQGLTHIAVLLAALPTGTGPFMLAEFYQREASVTAKAVLISTIGSLLTISIYLAWIG